MQSAHSTHPHTKYGATRLLSVPQWLKEYVKWGIFNQSTKSKAEKWLIMISFKVADIWLFTQELLLGDVVSTFGWGRLQVRFPWGKILATKGSVSSLDKWWPQEGPPKKQKQKKPCPTKHAMVCRGNSWKCEHLIYNRNRSWNHVTSARRKRYEETTRRGKTAVIRANMMCMKCEWFLCNNIIIIITWFEAGDNKEPHFFLMCGS